MAAGSKTTKRDLLAIAHPHRVITHFEGNLGLISSPDALNGSYNLIVILLLVCLTIWGAR